MTRKRNRKDGLPGFFDDGFWQSSNFNTKTYYKNLTQIIKLALNRFRWVGLPDSCDPDYLEKMLLYRGLATISHPKSMPDVWTTLQAVPSGDFNMYGLPLTWEAQGSDGKTFYPVDRTTGVLVYDSTSRLSVWNGIEVMCRRITHHERTADVNLSQQSFPVIISGADEQELEVTNFAKQAAGHEALIAKRDNTGKEIKVQATRPDIPLIIGELTVAESNQWNAVYRLLGIDHLAFQKGERMIEEEAKGNSTPNNLILLDNLTARRKAAREFEQISGRHIEVVFNDDYESYNWNYLHNEEEQAVDNA